jgi:glycosyltransferase involved in cell wall biosynthesis
VAPNTVDLRPLEVEHDAWEGRKEELTALKQGLNLEGRRVLLHIGSLQKGKPLDSLMDAYEELSTVSGALGMIVIGDGDDRTRLEKVVGDRALEGVRFLGRQISGLAKYALISDVAVFPHGATLGIITTLALGLPVVAACGRSPEHEAIVEGVNGSLAALGDTADLARTLGDILSGRVRFASSQQIRAMVHRDFSLHRMVDGLESALRYAVATKATSVPSMDKQMRGPK